MERFLRLTDIIGDSKRGKAPLIPISRSSWWLGVKNGRFPKPEKPFGPRIAVWRESVIKELLKAQGDAC